MMLSSSTGSATTTPGVNAQTEEGIIFFLLLSFLFYQLIVAVNVGEKTKVFISCWRDS